MTKLKDGKTHLADDELVNVTGGDEYDDTCNSYRTYEACMESGSASFCRWEV
ncbi:MAG: hypothetical protein PHD11_04280 [Bacteroidales bacterium]|nr:hypothetical protein [Bacteroidales bacterium]